jgi:hypothetical protein
METRVVVTRGTMYLEAVPASRGVGEDSTGFGAFWSAEQRNSKVIVLCTVQGAGGGEKRYDDWQ